MVKRLKLNEKALRDAEPKPGVSYQVFDTEVIGFAVRIQSSGARTFTIDYRHAGRQRRMTTQPEEALIDNRAGVAGSDTRVALSAYSMDRNPERNEAALTALQKHPLVRAILPPVLLELTDDRSSPRSDEEATPVSVPARQDQSIYPVVGVIDSGVASVLDAWVVGRFDYLSPGEYDTAHGTNVAGLLTIGHGTRRPARCTGGHSKRQRQKGKKAGQVRSEASAQR